MNGHDSELMESILLSYGFQPAKSEDTANIIILNTCSVREQAERKAIGRLQRLARRKKSEEDFYFGVTGCMAQNLGLELFHCVPDIDFVIAPRRIHAIGEVLRRLKNGERQIYFPNESVETSENNDVLYRRKVIKASAFVTIANGCNMNCAYCIVPKTRGREICRPMESILHEVQFLVEKGVREVTLGGQIVNFYGVRKIPFKNGKSPFVQLLEKVHSIDGVDRIRFLSPHPSGFRDDLIDCYSNLPKLCPHVHFPIQSGSDRILRAMRRPYTRQMALKILHKLRRNIPLMAISTDLIVGFPGETEEDFRQTEQLFSEVDFDMAFIFKYSLRTGTQAAVMDNQIPEIVSEERNQILLKKLAVTSYRRNRLFIDSRQPVLVEAPSTKDPAVLWGYTPHHKKVFFHGPRKLIGQIADIKISKATTCALSGTLADELV
jgi:tRNA-2-methylthio-N6-dimethylallyladenosine synthase